MEKERIHLKVVSHPENLEHIRTVVADITSKANLSEKDSSSVILAVDEACSNIIKHSYKNDYTQEIDLTILVEKDALRISIIDKGIKFDISSVESRDINAVKPGGLGIYIIKQIMDTLEYSRNEEGVNKIKMIKKLIP